MLPRDSLVFMVEADSEALYPDEAEWTKLTEDSRVTLLQGLPLEEARHAVEDVIASNRVRSVRPVWMTGAARRNRGYYERLLTTAEENLALAWQNRATIISFGRLWMRNLFTNLQGISYSIDDLSRLLEQPIFIAGAGPSLEEQTSFILEHRSALYLIAVDTALPFLLHIGAVPDAIVSVDAQHLNLKDLLPPPPSGVRLLFDLTAAPAFVRKFRSSDRFAFLSNFADTALWERLEESRISIPRIEAGGSVGTTALLLADRLRRNAGLPTLPILVGGLDFAFQAGLPHARMTYTHILSLTRMHRLEPLPFLPAHLRRKRLNTAAKEGGTITTDYVLAGYGAQLRAAAGRFTRVYDLSTRGVDLGLPVIGPEAAEELLSKSASERGQRDGRTPLRAHDTRSDAELIDPFTIRRFLNREEAALRDLATEIRGREGSEQELLRRLRERDYVSYYFPDPEPRIEESYLRRVIASISYLLRNISKHV